MKKLFLSVVTAVFVLVGVLAQHASATCIDKRGIAYRPAYVADATGTVFGRTPSGEPMRVTGLQPFREVCDDLLFRTASELCGNGNAIVDAARPARFCKKSRQKTHDCAHIKCEGG